jgi:hypothetical protein
MSLTCALAILAIGCGASADVRSSPWRRQLAPEDAECSWRQVRFVSRVLVRSPICGALSTAADFHSSSRRVSADSAKRSICPRPHCRTASAMGRTERPYSVSEYTTGGHASGSFLMDDAVGDQLAQLCGQNLLRDPRREAAQREKLSGRASQ